jgi:SAM-dependent methyltransferase
LVIRHSVPADKWLDAGFIRVWDARPSSLLRREQLDILAAVVKDNYRKGSRILDLGCGTGKLEQLLLARLPRARFTSVDRSPAMLEVAREKLWSSAAQVEFVQHDLTRLSAARLPGRPFRFIVSVNVIHELTDTAKRCLFRACRSNVARNGTLLIIDRVVIERQRLREPYSAVLHRLQRLNGEASGELSSDFVNPRAPDHEHPATLDQYFRWLRSAGFTPGLLHLHFHKALIAAKPGRQ